MASRPRRRGQTPVDRHRWTESDEYWGRASPREIAAAIRPQLNQYNLKWQEFWIDTTLTYPRKIEKMELMKNEWNRWLGSYESENGRRIGRAAFRHDWKMFRLFMPLQDRLFVEQLLYERGGFWRSFVKGFNPIAD